MHTIGTKIADYRKTKGITQENLAGKLGVTAQAVSKWENDISSPDIQLLVPLAKIFGITTDELLSNEPVKDVRFISESEKIDMKDLTLHVIVDSSGGDKVRINLPMELVKIALEIGSKIPQISENEHLKNIDFEQVMLLAEKGVIGNLVEVDSAGGDVVRVVVD